VTGRTNALSAADMLRLFDLLNDELARTDTRAELYLVGGAVMCLALRAREATQDIDAWFVPTSIVREAAARVAVAAQLPADWLNDAVKTFLSPRGDFDRHLERSHLQVFVATPRYLLALKCMAMRIGAEHRDVDDVRYLLRYLNITSVKEAIAVVTQYFDAALVPPKTRFALEELLAPK
jgi:hypothetical protein